MDSQKIKKRSAKTTLTLNRGHGVGHPAGVAVDGSGNLYVADTFNNHIREFTPGGEVSTLAENMIRQFRYPAGVAVDGSGNVYVADTDNRRIWKIEYK